MGFALRHSFPSGPWPVSPRGAPTADLPPELAFLSRQVDPVVLKSTAAQARRERVCAARALIAEGRISEAVYYQALAQHLGVAFDTSWPWIEPDVDIASLFRRASVRVLDCDPVRWLVAPQGEELRALLAGRLSYLDPTQIAITTPAHLAALIHLRAQSAIERIATHNLSDMTPASSAKGASDAWTWSVIALIGVYLVAGALLVPRTLGAVFGALFLASMVLRLATAVMAFSGPKAPVRRLTDAELPTYTVLVPLHREAEVLPDLLAALTALDYPRAKLQVLILIEPEDHATRDSLAALALPPWVQVVFAPRDAALRTKPRALNIGLMMATGDLITVYDAEDRPDPDQLRRAAATFRVEPDLACLQARLSIDNGDRSLLARMFAIEYAALFDVLNVGTAELRLPIALGGTSNHFRSAVLRSAGGWDPWNVTEDADLGLRLARLGHRVGCIGSTTLEAAPESLAVWMKQRRRWMKGWLQTLLVIARDWPSVPKEIGYGRSIVLALMLVNMAIGPLCLPVFSGFVIYRLAAYGLPDSGNVLEVLEATLATAVPILGIGSTLWAAVTAMKARGLLRFLPSLPALFPYQLLISAATILGLWDLMVRPFHWHKTPHVAHAVDDLKRPMARSRASRSAR